MNNTTLVLPLGHISNKGTIENQSLIFFVSYNMHMQHFFIDLSSSWHIGLMYNSMGSNVLFLVGYTPPPIYFLTIHFDFMMNTIIYLV
jgi:hypothetical protein